MSSNFFFHSDNLPKVNKSIGLEESYGSSKMSRVLQGINVSLLELLMLLALLLLSFVK